MRVSDSSNHAQNPRLAGSLIGPVSRPTAGLRGSIRCPRTTKLYDRTSAGLAGTLLNVQLFDVVEKLNIQQRPRCYFFGGLSSAPGSTV
jgi:hypothetical protein